MFFKKKESKQLMAPVDGITMDIEHVSDPVFAQKMMGDGFALKTSGNAFYALADAEVTAIFPSNHAYGLTLHNGLEILVHIGIDTVNENGKGFTCHTQLGAKVKAGDVLIEMDREYLLSKGYDLTTMVIFTNTNTYESFSCEYGKEVLGGKDLVATYE